MRFQFLTTLSRLGEKQEKDLRENLFLQVLAEFFRLPVEKRKEILKHLPQSLTGIISSVDTTGALGAPAILDWNDLYVLDAKILDAQDLAVVKRKAWEIRARYARLVGPEHLQQYLASQPPTIMGQRQTCARILRCCYLRSTVRTARRCSRKNCEKEFLSA
jgi:hypothetical protein